MKKKQCPANGKPLHNGSGKGKGKAGGTRKGKRK